MLLLKGEENYIIMNEKKKKFALCFVAVVCVIVILQLSGVRVPIFGSLLDNIWATDNTFAYEVRDDAVYIKGYEGKQTEIEIPEKLDGVSVKVIANGAFSENSKVKKVKIPDSVNVIEEKAFSCCTSLVQINIPEGVTKIGDETFLNCSNLSEIELPSSLKSIGVSAFSNTALKRMEVPDTVSKMGEDSFANCYDLTKVSLPGSLDKIENETFLGCSSLENINIPGSVSCIGKKAFAKCEKLSQLKIPSSVTQINDYAFEGCSSILTADIPKSVKEIGVYTFSNCSSLKDIKIAGKIDTISEGMFSECDGLERVVVPSNIEKISDKAFYDCSSLESAVISSGVTSIGESAFCKCSNLEKVLFLGNSPKNVENNAFTDINENGVIIVPYGKVDSYSNVMKKEKNLMKTLRFVEGSSLDSFVDLKKDSSKNESDDKGNIDESTDDKNNTESDIESTDENKTDIENDDNQDNGKTTDKQDNDVSKTKDNSKQDNENNDNTNESKKNKKSVYTVTFVNEDGSKIASKKAEYGTSIKLLSEPTGRGIFVGWETTYLDKSILCMEDSMFVIEDNMKFKAVYVDFKMLSGASIKMSTPTGIRYSSRINTSDYNKLKKVADNVEFGTLITLTDILKGVNSFTSKQLESSNKKFLDIPVKVWFEENESYREFTGVMTNVREKNYMKEFSARSYINITYYDGRECRFYSRYNKKDNSRSIFNVAKAAINDKDAYSESEISILKKFVDIAKSKIN